MRFSDIHWTWWILIVGVIAAVLAGVGLSGCATMKEAEWFSQERDLAVDIDVKQAELAELVAKANAAAEAAKANPTDSDLIQKYEDAMKAADVKARETAKKMLDLENLIEEREAAVKAEKEAREAATGLLDYVPEPFRTPGLLGLSVLFSLLGARGHYNARQARSKAVTANIVKSLQPVIAAQPEEQLKRIRKAQTIAARALVDEIQDEAL